MPMKLPLLLISLLGALALAQSPDAGTCQCPQVECPAGDPMALCRCLNGRELKCREACPNYAPTFTPCRAGLSAVPTGSLQPSPCVCEEVICAQDWPGSCFCANTAAQSCHDKCGGPLPTLQSCPTNTIFARAAVPEATPVPRPMLETAAKCTCEETICVQMWPDSCWCENAAAKRCHKKCGGRRPKLKTCPPPAISTVTTDIQYSAPSIKPTSPLQSTKIHKICGGGRANSLACEVGETCITDPYTPGCGPACDGLGICVKDRMCGGFGGSVCDEDGQICHDDPRDDCNPQDGGADCGGLCVWPHKSLHS